MRLFTGLCISFITAALTLQAVLKNGLINLDDLLDRNNSIHYNNRIAIQSNLPRYKCSYAGLWCTCYAKNNGGCSVGCTTNIYRTLYNQTSCPRLDPLMLAGFSYMNESDVLHSDLKDDVSKRNILSDLFSRSVPSHL